MFLRMGQFELETIEMPTAYAYSSYLKKACISSAVILTENYMKFIGPPVQIECTRRVCSLCSDLSSDTILGLRCDSALCSEIGTKKTLEISLNRNGQ